jgi:tetratricopeptide (TPR) repeat protein
MAIAHYRRALEIRPAFVEALVGIAVAYNLSGNGEQGLRILQDALNLASNRSGMIYFNIAEILERQGKKKQAIEHYLKSLDSEVDQDWVYHKLGVLYYETNQYEYARIAFEKALQIRTDPVTPYLKMIKLNLVLYENDKDHLPVIEQMLKNNINAEALEDFDLETIEKINKSDPEVAKTHNYLGAIDAIQGDTGKAIEHFRQSQQIWPDGIDARKNLQLLTQKK